MNEAHILMIALDTSGVIRDMESERPSLMRRAIAVAVLVIVAAIALKLVIGIVSGLIVAALWVIVAVALVGGFLWARRTLTSGGKKERRVESRSHSAAVTPAPGEDPVDVEIRRINEQLRAQGRR